MNRFPRWAGYLVLTLFILFFILLLNWQAVFYYVLKNVAQVYSGRVDITLDLGAINGKPFSETTFANVAVEPGPGQPPAYHFTARSITCRYNLRDLRGGLEPFIRGLNCAVNDPVLSYDLRVAKPRPQGSAQAPQFPASLVLPGLDVHNGAVILTDTGWDAEIREINSALRTRETDHELRIGAKNFRFNQGGETRVDTELSARLRYSGSKLVIAALDFADKEISATGQLDLTQLDKGEAELAAELIFAESRLNIAAGMANELVKARISTDHFDIGELQKRLGGRGWDLAGNIRAEAALAYNLQAVAEADGSFSFAVQDGQVNGVAVQAVTVAGNVQNGVLSISKAAAETPGNHVALHKVSVPLPLVLAGRVLPIFEAGRAEFAGEITDVGALLRLLRLEDNMPAPADLPELLVFRGRLANGSLYLDEVRVETAAARNRVTISNASVPMSLVLAGQVLPILAGGKAEFAGEFADLGALLRLCQLGDEVAAKAVRLDSMSCRGKLAKGVFYLEDARVGAVDAVLTVSRGEIPIPATAEAFASMPITWVARFASSNLTELAKLFSDRPVKGRVAVDMKIEGSVRKPEVDLKVAGEDLVVNGMELGSIDLQGNGQLHQETLGSLKSARVSISALTQVNNFGTLGLLAPATGVWQPGSFSAHGDLQMDGQGEISINVTETTGGGITAEIKSSNLDSGGWLGNFIDSRYFFHDADLTAVVTGLPKSAQLQLTGSVEQAGATDVPFPLTGRLELRYSPTGIDISEFTWQSRNRNKLTLTGHLPYDPLAQAPYLDGELSLKGHLNFPALEDIALFLEPWGISRGSLVLDLDLAGSGRQPVGHVRFRAEGIDPPEALRQYIDSQMNISCDLEAQGDSIILKSADLESPAYSARATGTWRLGISLRELLQNRQAELPGAVVADATVQLKDLNFFRKNLPWLRRLDGDIQGEFHVSGPVAAPSVKGSFSVQDGEASHTFNFPMLSAINLRGNFDEHSISIEKMQAELGGAPVNLSGKINKEQEIIGLDLHVDGKNVLLFRNNDMRIRGDVQLDVSGPLESLLVKGTTGLTGGYYNKNIDFIGKIGATSAPVSEGVSFLFSLTEPPFKDAVFDIKITTIEPFKIRNNLVRGVLRPELTLKGTGELPFLIGTIYIDPSRILLPSGRLQIQSGYVRFPEGSPDRPQLNILGQSKVMEYDINVIAKGALADPVITLSSSPALPGDDLLLLLLTGQPPRHDGAGGAKGSGARNVMVYLGRDFLNKWLVNGGNVNDETIFDRLELDFGRGVTRGGELMMESTFRLSKQVDRRGKSYYLVGEKDKYDAYNYGLKLVFNLE
jgi:hypothetical protein